MRAYYTSIFPESYKRVREHFRAAERLLIDNPRVGRATEFPDVRELIIPRTPFTFIYRVEIERIVVLRVWDARADRSFLDTE